MNKVIKKYMMAIVAVMLVIGFSAFKVVESQKTYQDDLPEDFIPWYYTGDDEDDVNDPTKYSRNPSVIPNCGVGSLVCLIYAPEDGNSTEEVPDLDAHTITGDTNSDTVDDLINEAMDSKQPNLIVESFKP